MKEKTSQIDINESREKNLAILIDHQRLPSFPQVLEDFLASQCDFDTFLMLTYKEDYKPIMLRTSSASETLMQYMNSAYVLDPLFNHIKKQPKAGIVRLAEIMPDYFEDTDYYRDCYRNFKLVDEIDFIIPLNDRVNCVITLGRKDGLGSITRQELKNLNNLYPIIKALALQFWQSQSSNYVDQQQSDDNINQAIQSFATGILTSREREITALLLQGFTSKEIADTLFISAGTVKVHRKNIHAKMNTSTQAEIFNLFLNHLKESALNP
ncbi:MAG: helix-turn-helix transcriptional regulator [Candidatus Pelagadaptatus aseana]|uniref:response regulator transcription factor n=1 Tax=Candidatus Pelagadaptatus aseana TaxID=3120508 RepID=UPI0039B28D27